MATDGSDTNRVGGSGVDNVVPFPREWIGPLDELVPLGPTPEDELDDEELGRSLAADTFWSEGSASLQQAVEAPVLAEAPPPPPSRRAGEGRWRIVAIGAAAACAAVGIAVTGLVASPAPSRGHSVAMADRAQLGGAAAETVASQKERLRVSRLLVTRAIRQASDPRDVSHRAVQRHHVAVRHSGSTSNGSATHLDVSYQAPSTSSGSAVSTTPSTSGVSGPSGGSGESAPQSESGSSSSSLSSPGPKGAGAPFGPGTTGG